MTNHEPLTAGRGLSGFDLKCIAVCSMLVDHIGAILYPSQVWMRYVGRMAFPIFGFLIVEGYLHTRDLKKYMGRLFLFALVSEIPYDLARFNTPVYWNNQNIFFTLLLALLCISILQRLQEHPLWAGVLLVLIAILTSAVIKPDYEIGGIVTILCFYVFRTRKVWQFASVAAVNLCYFGGIQSAAVCALIPVGLYNGKKGPSAKYFFYVFYPVHLLLLYLIRRYVIDVV